MGINAKTVEFKNKLIELINKSELPAVNVLLVLENVYSNVTSICNEAIKQESRQENMEADNGN